ncbi:uncharacterized protein H6S33_006908 [Morchella sextelata]|uniref:uncharacterized protein n=1 Tax=Morchella sextelata TaxID=1174677 RepID=UPI001D052D1B|nr:uncharacterized protein H6S33_006908 [Morchella sextelata]KAH0604531.1 hypothetical protein H6S33_006908 [Morchella sextelata]
MTSSEFDAAVAAVNSFKKMPSQDDALLFYAYFKTAKFGKPTEGRPGLFDMKGRYKYDAWAKAADEYSQEEAEKKYIELYESKKADYEN